MKPKKPLLATLLATITVLATGCAAITPARMALPEGLISAPVLAFQGLKGLRQGAFTLADRRVQFERGADRLSLFGVLTADKAKLEFRIGDDGSAHGRCDSRALQGTIGILDGALRPFGLHCRIEGDSPATLDLAERRSLAGTIAQREGRLQVGGVTLQIRSVHDLQGSAFQLAQPAGYLLQHEGQPVAALDLSDRVPQLRQVAAAPEVQRAVLLAAVALGLLWDPA